MPLFLFIGYDRKDATETRLKARPEHLEYARPHVRVGGAILDDQGAPIGSVMAVEAADMAAAQALIDADPYTRAGVFERTELHPWRVALGGVEGYSAG